MGAGHDHGDHGTVNEARAGWAAALTGGFMVAELAGGLVAGSLALVADAAHMAADALSLAMAWFAFRIARRPSDWKRTYGYGRFQVLVAFANGITLFLLIAWIAVEAIGRLYDPVDVLGGTMLTIALLGLVVNIAAFLVLRGADRENLNIRGAVLHVLGDLLGSVAALAAAGVILATGWMPIDPLLSLFVALLLARSAWMLVRDSGHLLLEGAPPDLDVRSVVDDLEREVGEVADIHHVHAWALNDDKPMLTLHARTRDGADPDRALAALLERLRSAFGVEHATVQIERGPCPEPRIAGEGHER